MSIAAKRRERKLAVNVVHQMVLTARERVRELGNRGWQAAKEAHTEQLKKQFTTLIKGCEDAANAVTEANKKYEAAKTKLNAKGLTWHMYGGVTDIGLTNAECGRITDERQKKTDAKLAQVDVLENKAILMSVSDDGGLKENVKEIQEALAKLFQS